MTKTIVVIVALIGAPRTLGLPALDVNEGHLTSTTPDFEQARRFYEIRSRNRNFFIL